MLLESTLYAAGTWLLIGPLTLALLDSGLKPVLFRLNPEASRFKSLRR